MNYYIAGIPYSDELYHHGILGQKWGVRRYQNSDGTLTAMGKVRYGAQKTGEALGNAAKATGKYAIRRFKERHPKYMTDDELRDYASRQKTLQYISSTKSSIIGDTFFGKAGKIMVSTLDTTLREVGSSLGRELGSRFAKELFKSSELLPSMDLVMQYKKDWKRGTNF